MLNKIYLIIAFLCTMGNSYVSAQDKSSGYIFTGNAAEQFAKQIKGIDFIAFPEDRHLSVQWFDSIRESWVQVPLKAQKASFKAQPGEYFTYQLAVWAINPLSDVKVKFKELKSSNGSTIMPSEMTCFNLGGINSMGKHFLKQISVEKGRIQTLWIGLPLENVQKGTYKGNVVVTADGKSQTIPLEIIVDGEKVENNGYNYGKGMSRMNWLNNTIGFDDKPTKQFSTLKTEGNTIEVDGRKITIGNNGLPETIKTYFTPSVQSIGSESEDIISSPMRFVIVKDDGEEIALKPGVVKFSHRTPSSVSWESINVSDEISMTCKGIFEYEGFADYKVTIEANEPIAIKDIRMEIPMTKDKSEYMMGLHHEGGFRPEDEYRWKWDTTRNQDMLWIGDVNGGLRIKWKAENYRRPLINIYYKFGQLHMPPSWGNGGAGGVSVSENSENVTVSAYSGSRNMVKGEQLHYDFELLVTPFRTVNKDVQFNDRYFHGGGADEKTKVAQAEKAKANIINIHHAGDLYPFINYPYLDENVEELNGIIKDAHDNNKLMKFYYTTRELTKNTPEFWAFYTLNGEIIFPGPGNESRTFHLHPNGPAEWLKTNIREKYVPAWYNNIDRGLFKGEVDLSVVTNPDSRLNNFYIGGLDWMVRNMGLDGVYIDDSALDRTTLRRARKVIDNNRPNGKMDLHSCNHFDPHFGYSSCLNMYMELLPYFDLCWIGEGRDYNRMPDHWLIEVAGIPYGLPGQMLQDGGNKWRGMVYGMTNRCGWGGDPTPIWRFWDEYDVKDKEMIGYWDQKNNPITIDSDMVKATVYKGGKQSVIALAGWGDQDILCNANIDWNKLGYNKDKCRFYIPEIEGYQEAENMSSLENVQIPKGKGFLIIVTED